MTAEGSSLNRPVYVAPWPTERPHQEVWYMKCHSLDGRQALWLRFTLLLQRGRGKRVAEVWGIYFEREPSGRLQKVAVKQTFPVEAFSVPSQKYGTGFQIADSHFCDTQTEGFIESPGGKLKWVLRMKPRRALYFDFIPSILRKLHIVKNVAVTVYEDLIFEGEVTVNNTPVFLVDAPGMQGHLVGDRNGHSWVWAHANSFVDESGKPASVVFDALSARARVGGRFASPQLTTLFCWYDEEMYAFNRLRDALFTYSEPFPWGWRFTTTLRSGIQMQGVLQGKPEDFVGVTYEDTDGSLLYCYNSKLVDCTLTVVRHLARQEVYKASGTAAFEIVRRTPLPEVPLAL